MAIIRVNRFIAQKLLNRRMWIHVSREKQTDRQTDRQKERQLLIATRRANAGNASISEKFVAPRVGAKVHAGIFCSINLLYCCILEAAKIGCGVLRQSEHKIL